MKKGVWSLVVVLLMPSFSFATDYFTNLPAAGYFDALYNGDYQRLNNMDAAFLAPYRSQMKPIQGMSPIFDALARNAGFDVDTAAALDESIGSISLIVPMLAVYLVNYQSAFSACVEDDAVRFRTTTASETVYRNGYGDYQYSIKHPDTVEYFTVNRRFARAFKEVGLTNPDSALGQTVDYMFGRNGRLNVRDITQGTRKLMDRWDCDSPVVARLEKKMLEYFDQHLQKRQGVAAAMGVGGNTTSSDPSSLLNACINHDIERRMRNAEGERRPYDAELRARDEAYARKWCNCIVPKLTRVLSPAERQDAVANYVNIAGKLSYFPKSPDDPAWRVVNVGNACRR